MTNLLKFVSLATIAFTTIALSFSGAHAQDAVAQKGLQPYTCIDARGDWKPGISKLETCLQDLPAGIAAGIRMVLPYIEKNEPVAVRQRPLYFRENTSSLYNGKPSVGVLQSFISGRLVYYVVGFHPDIDALTAALQFSYQVMAFERQSSVTGQDPSLFGLVARGWAFTLSMLVEKIETGEMNRTELADALTRLSIRSHSRDLVFDLNAILDTHLAKYAGTKHRYSERVALIEQALWRSKM